MSNGNLYARFERVFAANAERPALTSPDGALRLSYGDLAAAVARYANALAALGVEAGDRVTVQVEKSPASVFLYLAVMKLGAVYQPLNTAYTAAEVDYFVADAAPKLIVCDPARQQDMRTLGDRHKVFAVANLDHRGEGSLATLAATMDDRHDTVARQVDDLAGLLYTSGTTGRSKGAMITHGNLASNAETLVSLWRITGDDRLLHALPVFHVHGLYVALNTAFLAASEIVWFAKFDAAAMLAAMPGATLMMGVPTFYTRLLGEAALTREACRNMRLFISGSAPLLAETHQAFAARTGHAILERYGRMPEKTREEFTDDGYFITGDVGVIDGTGRVSIVGRAKDLIISGGFNVYPKEIEDVLDGFPGVGESAVIGVAHPDFGEGVVAVVTAKAPLAPEAEIIAALSEKLARFKVPKRIFEVPELPRNAMGKVQKAELRKRYADCFKR